MLRTMCKSGHHRPAIRVLLIVGLGAGASAAFGLEDPPGGALAGDRPRVIVSTDIGGSDNDDFQSMVHYLVYADVFDTEGLISSPPYGGRKSDILAVIDQYEVDYNNLRSHSPTFPSSEALRAVTKQGAINAAPAQGYSSPTEGSNWIIQQALEGDPRPLWILVWGSITDVAQAVHDDPGIKNKIRVYSIGSWNTTQDPNSRNYLYQNHSDLWWIECDTTMRGMYVGGDQSGDLGNVTFVEQHVRHHGALGDFYYSKKTDIKMGDTPSVMYLMRGEPDLPTTEHWGGMFGASAHGPDYWKDLTDPQYREGSYNGAKTVNKWRENYLRDWQVRMDWADEMADAPLIVLSEDTINRIAYSTGDLSDDAFTVANGGVGTLHYLIEVTFDPGDPPWLNVDPSGGSVAGGQDPITVSYSVGTLPLGTYAADIEVADNGSDPPAVNSPQNIAVTVEVKPIPGDFDLDGDVDQEDFGHFQKCLTGSGVAQTDPNCQDALLDEDEDVDHNDFGIFQACVSGANVPASPDCVN